MEKNNKSLWIGIIIVVVLVALYFLATRGGNQDYDMDANLDVVPASFEEGASIEGAIVDDGFFVEGEMPPIDEPAVVDESLIEEVNTPSDPGAM